MPKSNFLQRKNKPGTSIGGDFKRRKAKVGKRAAAKTGSTDTSFKSKRVNVSAQSILTERGDGIVGARGQPVETLCGQLKHYSASVRKDAFASLTTVVESHPDYAQAHFVALAEPSLDAAMADDDDVRKAFLAYQSALLRAVGASALTPFADKYVAYAASAMTALDAGVREDSLALVSLLLERLPLALCVRTGRLLPNFAQLLAPGQGGLRRKARRAALKTLHQLLAVAAATGPPPSRGSAEDLDSRTEVHWSSSGVNGVDGVLLLRLAPTESGEMRENEPLSSSSSSEDKGPSSFLSAAVLKPLLSRLQEMWMEAAAVDEASSSDATQLQAIADVLLALLACHMAASASAPSVAASGRIGVAGSSTLRAWLAQFVPLLLKTFPVTLPDGAVQPSAVAQLGDLNMALSELVAAAVASAAAAGAATATAASAAATSSAIDEWLIPALQHVQVELSAAEGGSSAAGVPIFSRICRLLQVVCLSDLSTHIVSGAARRARYEVLAAFGRCFESMASGQAKRMCIELACDIALASLAQTAISASSPEEVSLARSWLQALPPLLVEWGARRPDLSAKAVHVLLEVAKRTPLIETGDKDSARSRVAWLGNALAPFYATPAFKVLPRPVRREAAAILYHLPELPAPLLSSLEVLCCDASWADGGVRGLILETLHHRRRLLRPSEYLSLLLAVLLGHSAVASDLGEQRVGASGASALAASLSSAERKDAALGKTVLRAKRKRHEGDTTAASAVPAAAATNVDVPRPDARAVEASPARGGASAWESVLERDMVAEDVCSVLSRAGGKAVDALLPALLPVLEAASLGCGLAALRDARLSVLCLERCGQPQRLPSQLLGALSSAVAVLLGTEVSAACAQRVQAPAYAALDRWNELLPAVVNTLSTEAISAAKAEQVREGELMLRALLALLRSDSLRERLIGEGAAVAAAAASVSVSLGQEGVLAPLVRQICADAALIAG